MEPYEVDFLKRFDRGEEFGEEELKEFSYGFRKVDEIEGDEHRWYRVMQTIIEIGERYFSIVWQKGLTEMQENVFPYQPKEVVKKVYEKTIEVTEWVEVEV